MMRHAVKRVLAEEVEHQLRRIDVSVIAVSIHLSQKLMMRSTHEQQPSVLPLIDGHA
jgi:hypothetical protein